MKQFNQAQRGQVLIFVFFFLLILGVLAGSLAFMWQSQTRTLSSEKEGLIAFYLAQAGIERAKIEVLGNVSLSGASNWYNDTDISGDRYNCSYNFNVIISGIQRTLIGTGEVCNVYDNSTIAHREINITVDGIQDTDADGVDNNPPNNSVLAWSFREL